MEESLALHVAAAAVAPTVTDALLARAFQHEALTAAAAPALSRDGLRASVEIAARLLSSADYRERLALFRR